MKKTDGCADEHLCSSQLLRQKSKMEVQKEAKLQLMWLWPKKFSTSGCHKQYYSKVWWIIIKKWPKLLPTIGFRDGPGNGLEAHMILKA